MKRNCMNTYQVVLADTIKEDNIGEILFFYWPVGFAMV